MDIIISQLCNLSILLIQWYEFAIHFHYGNLAGNYAIAFRATQTTPFGAYPTVLIQWDEVEKNL